MKKMNYGKVALPIVISIALLLTGCADKAQAAIMDTTITVESQIAKTGELSEEGTYIGTISDAQTVSVIPQVGGMVEEVHVAVGDSVQAGDALCDYDDTNAEFSLASAQKSYASANVSYDSAEASYQSAVASYNSTKVSADTTLGSSKTLSDAKTEGSIAALQQTLNDQIESIDDYQDDRDEADDNKDDAEDDRNQALSLYTSAANKYAAAESILSEYAYYLENNAASFTTEGLEEAASGSVSGNEAGDQTTAQELINALSAAGLSVEDLNDSGLNLLEEKMEATKAAYTSAATAYSTAESTKNSLDHTIENLADSRNSTSKSLEEAQKEQKINSEEVYQDTVKSTDASLQVAQSGVDSAKVGISAAQVGIESAAVSVESAEYQLSLYHVKAPISGVVESVNFTPKNLYSSGSVAFVISNQESKTVTFYVTDEVRKELTDGQSVTVVNRDLSYQGAISEIGISVDQDTGLFIVKAMIYEASELATGSNAEVTLVTHNAKNVVLIPSDAVYFEDGDAYVYVAENEKAKKMPVTIALYKQDQAGISSGISAGAEIITTWSATLKDGASIRKKDNTSVSENEIAETESGPEEGGATE